MELQQEYVGSRSISNLAELISRHNPRHIFLVADPVAYKSSGAEAIIDKMLSGYKVTRFSDFEINPKLEDVEKGVSQFLKGDYDLIIAVGGGSALDVAKSLRTFASNQGDPRDYLDKKKPIEQKGPALVAIPTTAGTGSESTQFAVIWLGHTKYSLDHPFVRPDYAIVDPQFTLNLPKYITASTGMDALAQAVESLWCIYSTDDSKRYAREAIELVIPSIDEAVNNPSRELREAMAIGSHSAGKAINITRSTAPHAISYPITSYFGVPHGEAVGLTFPSIVVYNAGVTTDDVLDKRGVNYVNEIMQEIVGIFGARNPQEASQIITSLMQRIGLRTRLSEIGATTQEHRETIIQNGFNPARVNNNPRRLSEEALRKILNDIK